MDFKVDISARNCTNCGGNLVFDTTNKTAKCDSCGCVFDVIEKKDSFLDVKYKDGKLNSINVNTREVIDSVSEALEKPANRLFGYAKDRKEEKAKQKKKEQKIALIVFSVMAVISVLAIVIGSINEKKENEKMIPILESSENSSFDEYVEEDTTYEIDEITTSTENATKTKAEDEILTRKNNKDLKKLLSREGDDDEIASAFAKKYKGRKIEFDANIAYLAPYQDYTTRYNFMINYGDYSEDSQIGPSFRFTNVNFGDLNVEDGIDELKQGDNIHIVAKVIEFDEEHGIFELEPVSTKKR